MEKEYVKVVACVIASIGVHLILPYHFKTKGKSTHEEIAKFLKLLYTNLTGTTAVCESFFQFSAPAFSAVSERMFAGAKSEFGEDVLEAVRKFAELNMKDCILFSNFMLPRLGEVLSQQRGIF